eukprot:5854588-Amphidinium_carterae.1
MASNQKIGLLLVGHMDSQPVQQEWTDTNKKRRRHSFFHTLAKDPQNPPKKQNAKQIAQKQFAFG